MRTCKTCIFRTQTPAGAEICKYHTNVKEVIEAPMNSHACPYHITFEEVRSVVRQPVRQTKILEERNYDYAERMRNALTTAGNDGKAIAESLRRMADAFENQ